MVSIARRRPLGSRDEQGSNLRAISGASENFPGPLVAAPSPPDHSVGLRNGSGSLAMFAAMRRASSRVSLLVTPPARLVVEIEIAERLPVGFADDEGLRSLV